MKLSKILLTAFTAFVLTTITNADEDTLKLCKKAEKTFWETITETHNSEDQSFMESMDEQVQMSYYKMALDKINGSIVEVKNRCENGASKEILDAYNKKKSEIASHMNAL
jgi:hypothetical protein